MLSSGKFTGLAVLLLLLVVSLASGSIQGEPGTHSPHGNLNIPCQNCHTAQGWTPIRAVPEFNHDRTRYPLRGLHQNVGCTQCHVKPVFSNVGTRCQDCHADIHKRQLGANCEQCHSVRGWAVSIKEIQQHNNRFPLTGAHAAVDCDSCHKSAANSKFQIMSTVCFSCHEADFNSTTAPNHGALKYSTTCEQCHGTDNWLNAKFDHNSVGFPLTGGHSVPPRACSDCHLNNTFNLTSTACISCHQKDFTNATSPVPHKGFSISCETCHDTVQWTDGKFDHSQTGFPLTGMHQDPPRVCIDCHVNNNYNITDTTCISCHQKDFTGATSPVPHAGFPTTCEKCHDTSAWADGKFDHSTTGFTLTGMHTVPPRQCADCHNAKFGGYNLTGTACVTCHLSDFQGATNPNHVAGGFSQTCELCHSTSGWSPATFDHSKSAFPLTGSHTVPPRTCADCHGANNYNITDTTCISCHQKDFTGATSPVPHTGFPTTCQLCHDTIQWTDATFNHNNTPFPLTGSHTVPPRACADCHTNNNYTTLPTACIGCHQKDFNGANSPPHTGFPTTCEQCHDTLQWTDAKFDHSQTGFPLTGNHTVPPRACADCHVNNNYNLNSALCITCHQKDFNGANSPVPHTGFPTTCEMCHDTTAWTDATFNHNNTPFPLTGSHTVPPRACADCHTNNNYASLPTTCIGCHQTDYNNAKSPVPHTGFPTTCENCHDTIQWTDGKFDHSQTGFPLTGSHTVPPRACTDCHINNNYSLNSTLCITCHQNDFNGANSPVPHTGFPTTCELCHDTIVWTDATFNHNNTAFPLTGSHTVPPRACADCHVNNNYTTLPTTCIGCHQTDYNNTTNPGHAAQPQFFPTTCQNCHSTTNWLNATFNHTQYTQFSINHGNANGVCATCHTNSNDYSIFQCTNCHAKAQTDSNHQGVKGYVYNSVNCYQCHSSGQGG